MIPYIGDISKADAQILKDLALISTNILEFGCGASTQVIANYCKYNFTSVETEKWWIERTQENLDLLGIKKGVKFEDYYKFVPEGEYDFIFDDGTDEFRLPFAFKTWQHLKIGGYLLFHDTRRGRDVQNISDFIVKHSPEIESVFINKDHSNITVIKKKVAEFYENWNEVEGREPWESGYVPVDVEKLKLKIRLIKSAEQYISIPYKLASPEEKEAILASQFHDYKMAGVTIYPGAPKGMGINEFSEWKKSQLNKI